MQGEYYRLNTPILAIMSLPNGKRIPITVPKGAVMKVVNVLSTAHASWTLSGTGIW
jgi:hypothetical protein